MKDGQKADPAASGTVIPTELRLPPTRTAPPPPAETLRQSLPFAELAWEDFERLCLRLAEREGDVVLCQRYGVSGEPQQGLDIIVRLRGRDRYSVWQCKRSKSIRALDIRRAVNKFLEGSWWRQTETFYLCTSTDIRRVKILTAVDEAGQLLQHRGILFVPLGLEGLSILLKNNPDLVYDFFGAEWLRLFCGEEIARSVCVSRVSSVQRVRYLTRLVEDLESRKGVREHIELEVDPCGEFFTDLEDSLYHGRGWGPEFSVLIRKNIAHPMERSGLLGEMLARTIQRALELKHRLVLLGSPGSGKTTILRKLARDCALRCLEDGSSAIPVLCSLANWREDQGLWEFLNQDTGLDQNMRLLFAGGGGVLYLDGLNEMALRRDKKTAILRDWLHSTEAPKDVIVACREEDYVNELVLGLPGVRIKKLDRRRVGELARNYLGAEQAESFLARVAPERMFTKAEVRYKIPYGQGFRRAVRVVRDGAPIPSDESYLFHLAQNPYLCSALIFIYQNSPTKGLPTSPCLIFNELIHLLWERERLRQTAGWVPFEEMVSVCAALGFTLMKKGLASVASRRFALKHLGSVGLLTVCARASFLDDKGSYVCFNHELLQEYFAAIKLSRRKRVDVINKPKFQKQEVWPYGGYCSSASSRIWRREASKWDRSVQMASEMLTPVDFQRFLRSVAAQDPFLAADCAAQCSNVDRDTKRLIESRLLNALRGGNDRQRGAAADALGKIRAEGAVGALFEVAVEEIKDVLPGAHEFPSPPRRIGPATNALCMLGTSIYGELLSRLSEGRSLDEREAAVYLMGVLADPRGVDVLDRIAFNEGEDPSLRGEAIRALGDMGSEKVIKWILEVQDDDRIGYDWKVYLAKMLAQMRRLAEATIPALVKAVCTVGWNFRLAERASLALVNMGSAAVPAIISVVQEKLENAKKGPREIEAIVRLLRILAETNDRRAIPIFAKAFELGMGPSGIPLLNHGKESVPYIVKLLECEPESIREMAADFLGRLGDLESVEDVAKGLWSSSERCRYASALALGRMGLAAVQTLEKLSKAEDPELRRLAAIGLGEVQWLPAEVRVSAEASEVEIGFAVEGASQGDIRAAGADALIDALRDEMGAVRLEAVRSLAKKRCREAEDELKEALKDSLAEVREEAQRALEVIFMDH